jgi:hypothetical protein
VICSVVPANPWILLANGCSLVALPEATDEKLLRTLVQYSPSESEDGLQLQLGSQAALRVSIEPPQTQSLDNWTRIDPHSGQTQTSADWQVSGPISEKEPLILWRKP